MRLITIIITLLVLNGSALIGFGIGLIDFEEELSIEEIEYCEMVEIYHSTNDGLGWPDYRGIYNKMCVDSEGYDPRY